MKPLQRLYLATVVVAGVSTAVAVARPGVPRPGAFVLFAALALGAELMSVRLPGGATASALMGPLMAALITQGGAGAYLAGGLVAGFGGCYLPDLRQRRRDRVAFNSAQLLLSGCASALVFAALDPAGSDSVPRVLAAALAGGLVFLLANVALLAPMLAMATDRSPRAVVRELNPLHLQYIPFGFTGTALGWMYVAMGPMVVPLSLAPVLIARQTFSSYLALKAAHESTLRTLVRALERKDPYTAGHTERVARYARYVGEELGLSESRLERLRFAALMHDVGKLVVSNHLLNKPGRLTAEEYEQVRLHESVSVEILERIDFLRPVASATSQRYHRYDAVDARSQPIEPYIIVVADAYDAMTSTRSYRRAMSQAVSFAELRRCAGTQFHPGCVEALIRALQRRREVHGPGYEVDVYPFAVPPPVRGPGSAGLGDLAPTPARSVREASAS